LLFSPGWEEDDHDLPLPSTETLELVKDVQELRSSHEPPSPSVVYGGDSDSDADADPGAHEEDDDGEEEILRPMCVSLRYQVSSERGHWRGSERMPYLMKMEQERMARRRPPPPPPPQPASITQAQALWGSRSTSLPVDASSKASCAKAKPKSTEAKLASPPPSAPPTILNNPIVPIPALPTPPAEPSDEPVELPSPSAVVVSFLMIRLS
jgi:hypothetical protein